MNHLGTKKMETSRLVLRPFVMEDAVAMYRNWASDPEVTKFLSWPTYKSVDDAHAILDIWTKQYSDNTFYQWAIELKEIGQPIGSISVVSFDDRVDMMEIGFCVGKNWWGQGIMTEAFQAVIDYLFSEVGVQRIEAGHDPNNPASGAVQRKCGLKYEGTFHRRIRSNQGITDVAWYAILKEEWKKMIPKLRNMTSLYLVREDTILCLYRIGSRVLSASRYIGSCGGHFEENELNDPQKCILREMEEELDLKEDDIEGLSLRYITHRLAKGEIRQNYYFFARLKEEKELSSNEGFLKWVPFEEVPSLPMPVSAKHVILHYLSTGRFDDCLYCGITEEEGTGFVPMVEFEG